MQNSDRKRVPALALGVAQALAAGAWAQGTTQTQTTTTTTTTTNTGIAARGPVHEYLATSDYHYLRDLGLSKRRIAAITLMAHHAGVPAMQVARRHVFGAPLSVIARDMGMDIESIRDSADELADRFPEHRRGQGNLEARTEFWPGSSVAGMREERMMVRSGGMANGQQLGRMIELTTRGTDFSPNEIRARPGERITISLWNRGEGMHNIELRGMGYQARLHQDLGAGQRGLLTLTAPDRPGRYEFVCPQHPDTMRGTLIVE